MISIQDQVQNDTETNIEHPFKLVLYNDDVNTFEWVETCLQKYCGYSYQAAQQAALIVHYKGRYIIKHGSHDELQPISEQLADCGLSVQIEMS